MDDFPIEGSPVESPAAPDAPTGRRPDPRRAVVDPLTGDPIGMEAEPFESSVEPSIAPAGGSGRRWRTVALTAGLVFAILLGATGRLAYSALNRGSAPAVANASPSAGSLASPTPAGTPGASTPLPAPSRTAGPTATATATPAPLASGAAAPATVTFNDLMLDAAPDSGATVRTFAFTTDGPGSVSAQVTTAAPLTNLKMCLQSNGGQPTCATGATPGFFTRAPSTGDQAQWIVTLVATDPGATPVVDVAFTWRTKAPAITLSHGRLQGAPNPDSLRGFTATFQTRAAGTVGVTAAWPPASADVALTLTDVTTKPASAVDKATFQGVGGISPAYSHAVAAGKSYQIRVADTGSTAERPDLTATITFP